MLASVLYRRRVVSSKRTAPRRWPRSALARAARLWSVQPCLRVLSAGRGEVGKDVRSPVLRVLPDSRGWPVGATAPVAPRARIVAGFSCGGGGHADEYATAIG